ncbi:MAG: hypothetical protein ACQERD_01365 [Campylobacterota bacterium]
MHYVKKDISNIANKMYKSVFRIDFDKPGFYLVDLGRGMTSSKFRKLMVSIKEELSKIHISKYKKTLIYLSAGRFDQQESTKPHLDGGPEESILMLGYEPSCVDSIIEIADYTKCAYELGITPDKFMQEYNPMFEFNKNILQPYNQEIKSFNKNNYQILCINNSSAPYITNKAYWQGVLHTATIINSDSLKQRIINSTMFTSASLKTPNIISEDELDHFINTTEIKQKIYS